MKRKSSTAAFSLVEVALGLTVAAFCLLTLIALIPTGITANEDSLQKTTAASLASAVVSDLQGTAAGGTTSIYSIPIPAAGGAAAGAAPSKVFYVGGDGTAYANATVAGALYRVSVGLYPPAAGSRAATSARVLVTWPAPAGGNGGSWPTTYTGSFETTTALNCN